MGVVADRPRRTARRAVTALGLTSFLAGASLLATAGTASAAVTPAHCNGEASGPVGAAIELPSETVQDMVVRSVRWGIDSRLLDIKSERTRMREAFEEGKFDPIPLGTVSDSPTSALHGSDIAEAVLAKIDSVDEVSDIAEYQRNRDRITSRVSDACALTVLATNYGESERSSSGSGSSNGSDGARSGNGGENAQGGEPANGSGTQPTPDSAEGHAQQGGSELPDARAPRRDYDNIPAAEAGEMLSSAPPEERYGTSDLPGLSPEFGMLGADESDGAEQQAGDAEALAGSPGQQTVQLPMLLAVVAFAGTAAALFRTWVLRKV
ncbi:hypothetical protein [Haloechinothrix sp. LS1_15]|uniref:hypothetical protein n=1 Tax=Haloechinothrix sp. LS1_15 TaxID=2652248 RepID=UPI00294839BF|nr:hypothetical protein [Haloechinothrix sp. LS1_15]MDV6011026.1 hypothetical protein [Haloechinothrix sp. LS1_15]